MSSRHRPSQSAPLRLEPLGPEELGVLAEAAAALWVDEGAIPPDPVTLRVRLLARLRTGARAVRILGGDDAPLGHALWHRSGAVVRIEQFRIDPDHRRRGWGRRALAALLAEAGPASAVHVRVLEDNAPALAFWRAAGFGAAGGPRVLEIAPRPGATDSSAPAPGG